MAKKKADSRKSKMSTVVGAIIVIAFFIYTNYYSNIEESSTKQERNEYLQSTEINDVETSNESNLIESSDDLEVYYFDVGQADSILVASNGEYMLIDAGNNNDGKLIVNQLKEMGIKKLNYLIGTHPHEDHIGGLDNVIDSFDIGTLYMPKRQADSKTFEDVLDSVAKKKLKITTPKVGDTFKIGEAVCKIMSVESDAEDTNNSSIVIELTYGIKNFLFTGDVEKEIEDKVSWDDIDVLKVGHHGSRYSSTKEFLQATTPEIAVISVGEGNDYGHPHSEAIKRLEKFNSKIYRTDEIGTILIKCDGKNIFVNELDISLDGK